MQAPAVPPAAVPPPFAAYDMTAGDDDFDEVCTATADMSFLINVMETTDLAYVTKLLSSNHPNALPFSKGCDPRKDIRWLLVAYSPLSGA